MIQYTQGQDRRGTPLLPGSALLEGMAVDALVEVDGALVRHNILMRCAYRSHFLRVEMRRTVRGLKAVNLGRDAAAGADPRKL